jgi:hypothetical protein
LAAVGGLAIEAERDLARELVTLARRAEQLQEVLHRLLRAGDVLASQGACPPAWGQQRHWPERWCNQAGRRREAAEAGTTLKPGKHSIAWPVCLYLQRIVRPYTMLTREVAEG